MVFSRFFGVLFFRILLLLTTCLAIAFIIVIKKYWFTAIGLLILLGIQVYALMMFLNKTNEFIAKFVNYLREENTNFQIPERLKKPPYDKLIQSLQETGLFIRKTILLKEHHYHYLQYIVNSVGVGILVFNRNGDVDLINPAAKSLLNIRGLTNIRELTAIDETFENLLLSIKPGEERSHKMIINSQLYVFSFNVTEFKIADKYYKLTAFQNIRDELDQKELESWQTLIRVLSHELMNTITPVNSLTKALVKMYQENKTADDPGIKEDTREGLELISERVSELLLLVERYKILSRLPSPIFKQITVRSVVGNVVALLKPEAKEKNVVITLNDIDPDITAVADEQMLSQVLINVIRNAIDAAEEAANKNIDISMKKAEGHAEIRVTDYGKGITADELNKVFIPFYTTKANGSGIGLSLSRQIMRLHKGQITAISTPGEFTTFIVSI
jgi:signal transduction histidine kinase